MKNKEVELTILYDQHCPACKLYVKNLEFNTDVETSIVGIRDNNTYKDMLEKEGLDINKGLVVSLGSSYYVGPEAMRILTSLNNKETFLSNMLLHFFKTKKRAKIMYSIFTQGRMLLLKILRIDTRI